MGLAWLLLGQPQSTALSAGLAWKLLGQSQLMVQWAELAWQLVQLYLQKYWPRRALRVSEVFAASLMAVHHRLVAVVWF